jgi:hypothetical protein
MIDGDEDFQLVQAHQLLLRLEHLSADSYWAHRASGLRGSLLRCIEQVETPLAERPTEVPEARRQLDSLIERGFWILEKAAREIPATNPDQG